MSCSYSASCFLFILVLSRINVIKSSSFLLVHNDPPRTEHLSSKRDYHPFSKRVNVLSLSKERANDCTSDDDDETESKLPLKQILLPYPSSENINLSKTNSRRSFLFLTTTAIATTFPTPETNASSGPNFDCLSDLPPITPDCIRVFLCRHGQTENNRLRLVQGARIDLPINDNGIEMARRLGKTLSNLSTEYIPVSGFHSKLKRAKQTAMVTSEVLAETTKKQMKLETLSSLGEVDFGDVDGMKVEEVRGQMMKAYMEWSAGLIDYTMDGGETGRDVLNRIVNTLNFFSDHGKQQNSESKTIMAVSHSTYLRMLLATCLDIPLAKAATMEQLNGCINVLDVHLNDEMTMLGSRCNMFGGSFSLAKQDEEFVFPKVEVIRMNEIRHLEGI